MPMESRLVTLNSGSKEYLNYYIVFSVSGVLTFELLLEGVLLYFVPTSGFSVCTHVTYIFARMAAGSHFYSYSYLY